MSASIRTRVRPPAPADDWALFLDVDGCLLDLAAAPDAVTVPAALPATLAALARRLQGALALVSGRSIAGIDALFAPLRLPAAGLHGLELRSGERLRPAPVAPAALAGIREEAALLALRYPGVVVEDKGAALGLHWRAAPPARIALHAFAEAALPRLPGYRLQHGDHVVELRPADGDKGAAIRTLLQQPPFRDRLPVFAGDDLTDESGFAVVNACGGLSVLVGARERSAAHYALRNPAAVRGWLGAAGPGPVHAGDAP
ncbi:trehalose-phosphatase [Cognatiluteimonas weifangensis]|uniref:Trehalose 6-phosphate phosphatase n=1 Tax=Cognatiluteimonas weifangensis TaxID=2303539 RepID=A0A372DSC4_9GAMM|nr:trehalose-phosphatase [Luteimonas weifangensis]RFP62476.1 trehalose-phosphatase [Luteimonas weifangensis]